VTVDFSLDGALAQAPIEFDYFHEWLLPDGSQWLRFYRTGAGYLLRFPGLADFRVASGGLQVICTPALGVTEETARHLYLNQVLPLALAKQGVLVFHASAVEIDDSAVAFMAESGRGKSTLAASFASSGFPFLTDDSLLLEEGESSYIVQPSHPSIRLWDDSKHALINDDAQQAPAVQYTPKARILFGDTMAFCPVVQPLRRVYFLGDGSATNVVFRRMQPSEALIGLVRNTFLLDIDASEALATHFDQLTKMVAKPIFYELDYPRRFEELALVRQAVVEHVMNEDRAA